MAEESNTQIFMANTTDEMEVYGGAGLGRGTPYSHLCTTDMSRRLDELFGFNYKDKIFNYIKQIADCAEKNGSIEDLDIDDPILLLHREEILSVSRQPILGLTGEIRIPVSSEVKHNILSARCLMVAYHGSERFVDYFTGLAMKVGYFFALPYDEVIRARESNLDADDIEVAVKEGYARKGSTTHINGRPMLFVELTDKFCPLEKSELGLDISKLTSE